MKSLLLLAIFSASSYASTYVATSRVTGYSCPNGYSYKAESGLCYLGGSSDNYQAIDNVPTGTPKTVKRRKYLDKKAIHELLEGDFFKEEPSDGVNVQDE